MHIGLPGQHAGCAGAHRIGGADLANGEILGARAAEAFGVHFSLVDDKHLNRPEIRGGLLA